jgi:signal transduction histidine kinase
VSETRPGQASDGGTRAVAADNPPGDRRAGGAGSQAPGAGVGWHGAPARHGAAAGRPAAALPTLPVPMMGGPRADPGGEGGRQPDRFGVRIKLTLWYGGLFFAAGSLLLAVTYALVAKILRDIQVVGRPGTPREALEAYRQWFVDQVLQQLLWQSVVALLGVGLVALVLGWFVADRALAPLQRVTATARRLSESTLHERIALQGPEDEIKELADTFDAMLERLNQAFDAQRRFVANASHELRTPLAINRTLLEVALADPEVSGDLKSVGRTLLATNARHERLIEGLLLLARSERELTNRTVVDLEELTRAVLTVLGRNLGKDLGTSLGRHRGASPGAGTGLGAGAGASGEAAASGDASAGPEASGDADAAGAPDAAGDTGTADGTPRVQIVTELTPAPTIGDPVLLERLVSNLVENAIKHNVERGTVIVRTGLLDGFAACQVENTGPVVPAYEVERLFEPFRRLHADRLESAKGAGLGLSIVRSVVRAHGGAVNATPRTGGGLVVTVRLPPAPR